MELNKPLTVSFCNQPTVYYKSYIPLFPFKRIFNEENYIPKYAIDSKSLENKLNVIIIYIKFKKLYKPVRKKIQRKMVNAYTLNQNCLLRAKEQ